MNGVSNEVIEETIYELVVEKKGELNAKKKARDALFKKWIASYWRIVKHVFHS